jgi:hypothetical protein
MRVGRWIMTEIGTIFLALAVPLAVTGVVLMMAMTGALHARGYPIHWVFLRLYIFKYIGQYRAVTTQETGRAGPLFYPFIISMNLALVLTILGLVLR